MKAHYLFYFILFALFSTSIEAKIYSWKDENGNMHFSDSPPPHNQYDEIPDSGARSTNVPAYDQKREERVLMEGKEIVEKEEAEAKRKAEKAKRIAEDCKRIDAAIKSVENSPKIRKELDNGEFVEIDGKERDAEIQKLRDRYAERCTEKKEEPQIVE